jgi:Ca-activated chloride channel family protein
MPTEKIAVPGLISTETGTPIPLLGTKASAQITGRGAHVTIAQRFKNTEKQPIESVYKFPIPESGAVCGFRALVEDRKIEGKIEDRDEAFRSTTRRWPPATARTCSIRSGPTSSPFPWGI